MNDFGLTKKDIFSIQEVFEKFPKLEKAIIFGSRSNGNFKVGSDIDIALKGKVSDILFKIKDELEEELPLPYFFDVVEYNKIDNLDLKNHIDRVGKVIYKK